jgi:N-methylhydantoinase B
LNGGKAGQPFCVTVDAEAEGYDLGGLVDGESVLKGQVVRVVTTGGGGWGDPLQRELELVLRDVIEGRVSPASAEADYGVVFKHADKADQPEIDEAATKQRRDEMVKARNIPTGMIDRGEGYEKMLRGEHRPRMR